MSKDFDIPLLGQLPLAMEIRSSLDAGTPTVISSEGSELADTYVAFARRTAGALSQMPRNLKLELPNIVMKNS